MTTVNSDMAERPQDVSMKSRKTVGFDIIQIHEHAYELGDNPCVSDGAPLTIAWACQESTVFDIEYYEICRPSASRRSKHHLRLSVTERAQLLLVSGYSLDDIVCRTLEAQEEKRCRAESCRNKRWDSFHEAMETTGRTLKTVARRGSLLAAAPVRICRRGSLLGHETMKMADSSRRNSVIGSQAAPVGASRRGSLSGSIPVSSGRRNSAFGNHRAHVGMDGGVSISGATPGSSRRNSLFGAKPAPVGTSRRASLSEMMPTKLGDQPTRRHSLVGVMPLGEKDAHIDAARTA